MTIAIDCLLRVNIVTIKLLKKNHRRYRSQISNNSRPKEKHSSRDENEVNHQYEKEK
ncbi:MAG: hypothetical protein ACI8RD_009382 [Bacillariaceae sp.]|jgi:hypothetical protein